MFAITEILDLADKLERNGEATYRRAISQVADPELTALLEWMAEEEAQHAKWFSSIRETVAGGDVNPFLEEMSRELFEDLIGDQSFSLREVDFSSIKSTDQMLKVFIEFERDTVTFYEILIPFVDDEDTLAQLRRIIAEENLHIERLSEFMTGEVETENAR